MHRLFGKKKEVAPPPSLTDTAAGINGRVTVLDDKIKGLDNELKVYKAQLAKAKGPAKTGIQRRAMEVLKRFLNDKAFSLCIDNNCTERECMSNNATSLLARLSISTRYFYVTKYNCSTKF
jgi:hypothetical protein